MVGFLNYFGCKPSVRSNSLAHQFCKVSLVSHRCTSSPVKHRTCDARLAAQKNTQAHWYLDQQETHCQSVYSGVGVLPHVGDVVGAISGGGWVFCGLCLRMIGITRT